MILHGFQVEANSLVPEPWILFIDTKTGYVRAILNTTTRVAIQPRWDLTPDKAIELIKKIERFAKGLPKGLAKVTPEVQA